MELSKNVNIVREVLKYFQNIYGAVQKKITQSSHTIDGNHGNVEFRNQSLANIDNENSVAAPEGTVTDYDERMQHNRETNYIECHCGKLCNGNRGLRAHQRFSHVNNIPELRDVFVQEIEQLIDNDTDNSENESIINHVKIIPKKGVKLPKTTEEWNTANEYFKQHLNSCENSMTMV